MIIAAEVPAAEADVAIEVEADVDLGVTSRMLDLLVIHGRLPNRMSMVRDKGTMRLSMTLSSTEAGYNALLAKMRQLPGVRWAEAQ